MIPTSHHTATLEKTNLELKARVEEKLAILQSIGDGVVMLDHDGNINFINTSATQLTGWSETDALHKNWTEVVPLEYADGTKVSPKERSLGIDHTSSTKNIQQSIYYCVRKNQTRFPISATSTPVMIDGQLVGSVIVFHDVTREKEVSQLKEEFLSLATHQLRNPLTTILWTLDLLLNNLDTESPEKIRSKMESMKRNALNMSELITDILTITRINDPNFKEQPKPTNLPESIEKITAQVRDEAQTKKIGLKVTVATPNLTAQRYLLDQNLLSQCLTHILANAIRYSHAGDHVEIILSSKGDQVCIAVKDQGIGIPEQDKAHIFDRFYRGQNVPTENMPGSGLGLFIVKSIVTRWHGNLTVESQENQGTTITLCLPLLVVTSGS